MEFNLIHSYKDLTDKFLDFASKLYVSIKVSNTLEFIVKIGKSKKITSLHIKKCL